ncbi:MAG TPA: hypothetical protein VKA34_11675 [Balneolales bacterium]|nr:hypothetical protein [Balneolales bacterium]
MKYLNLIILFSLLGTSLVYGQQSINDTGSLYSYYGIGNLNDYRSTDAQGMGMTGIGLFDRAANLANPAIWGNAYYTSGTGGFYITNIQSSNRTNKTQKTNLEPSQFQIVFPVKRSKIGISLAMFPISSMNYHYTKTGSFNTGASGSLINYNIDNYGSGGIDYLELGIGWHINKNLSIGYAPSLVFGLLNDDVQTSFNSPSYLSTRYIRKTSNIGFGNRAGIFYEKYRVFNKHDQLSVGLTANMPVKLHSTLSIQNYITSSSGNVNNPTQDLKKGNILLPLRAGLGVSYWFNQRIMVGSEVLYQKWSDFKGINGKTESFMKDRYRVGLGTQLLPSNNRSNNFFRHLAYRLGLSYDSGYLKLNGRNIQTFYITAGLGIPSPKIASSININAEYGFRGTQANSLIKERIFSLRISFNLSELMFVKHKIQ